MDVNECTRRTYQALADYLIKEHDAFKYVVQGPVELAALFEVILPEPHVRKSNRAIVVDLPKIRMRAYGFDLLEGRKHYEALIGTFERSADMPEEVRSELVTAIGDNVVIENVGTILAKLPH